MIGKEDEKVVRRKFPCPPDTSLFPKLGTGAGYSLSQAITELIDNAYDARTAEKLRVKVSFHWEGRQPNHIVVKDNGHGMSEKKLREAMILGKSEKGRGKLGLWGLGLKTSCLCIGQVFSVKTAEPGGKIYSTKFDEREWGRQKVWELEIEERPNPDQWHGTVVEIRGFKMEIQKTHVWKIARELVNAFQHMIVSGIMELKIRDIIEDEGEEQSVSTYTGEPAPLQFTEKKDFKIEVRNGVLSGFVGILKKPLKEGYWGFHTFWNKKMIVPFSKIGFPSISFEFSDKLIHGQVHMDHLSTTYDKREWIVTSPEYREANKKLAALVKPFRNRAKIYEKSLVEKKKYKTVPSAQVHQLLRQAIKCFKAVASLSEESFLGFSIKKNPLGDMSGVVNVEKRDKLEESSSSSHDREQRRREGSRGRVPKKTQREDTYVMRVGDKRFRFKIRQAPRTMGEPWKFWERNPKTGGIVLDVNTAFFLWQACRAASDRKQLLLMIIHETISEISSGNERLAEMRDNSMREFLRVFGD